MKTLTIPLLWRQEDVDALNYPDDIQIGLYVWDPNMKKPILICDESSVFIHKTTTSRTRFATHKEIITLRKKSGNKNTFKTVFESTAYGIATAIYYLEVFN
jgi:hypothetical protein